MDKETPEQRQKRKRDTELADLRHILKDPEGRRFMWRLLGEAKLFHGSFVMGDQGYGTTYNEGRRSIGCWAFSELLEAKPEAYNQMQREHSSLERRDEIIESKTKKEKEENVLGT